MNADRDDRTSRLEAIQALVADEKPRARLFRARVVVRISASVAGQANGWTLLKTLVQLVARTVAETIIGVDSDPSRDVKARLNRLCSSLTWESATCRQVVSWMIDDPKDADVVCVIGQGFERAQQGDLFVGSTAWQGMLSMTGPRPVSVSAWPFGALGAACLAAAGVFRALIRTAADAPVPLLGSDPSDVTLDLWDLSLALEPANARTYPEPVAIAPFEGIDVVGGGAVANGVAWALAHCPRVSGTLTWWDDDRIDTTSLNRCLLARPRDINELKVELIARSFVGTAVTITPRLRRWSATSAPTRVLVSTVDNNNSRHIMQEALPQVLYQAATHDSSLVVSRHNGVDGRSCLICRHPDRAPGTEQRMLGVAEAAQLLGLAPEVVDTGRWNGQHSLTPSLALTLGQRVPSIAADLQRRASIGEALCGVLGDLRVRFANPSLPPAASVGFASILAGVIAAAELTKAHSAWAAKPPANLDNVLQIDLLADLARQASNVVWREPPRRDCTFCQVRGEMVRAVYAAEWNRDRFDVPRQVL